MTSQLRQMALSESVYFLIFRNCVVLVNLYFEITQFISFAKFKCIIFDQPYFVTISLFFVHHVFHNH